MRPTAQHRSERISDLKAGDFAQVARAHFSNWRRLIESLPISSDEYSFLFNWLESARSYWNDGEYAVARYQLGMMRRRLREFVEEGQLPQLPTKPAPSNQAS